MANGKRGLHLAFGSHHRFGQPLLGFRFDLGIKDETHAAAGHAAQHPKAPEPVRIPLAALFDQQVGEAIGGPGDDRLQGALEVTRGDFADPLDVAILDRCDDLIQYLHRFAASFPFALTP